MENEINKTQNERLKALEGKECIQAKNFIAALVLLTTIFLGIFGYFLANLESLQSKIDQSSVQFMRIEAQLSQIQTDLQWIKRDLNGEL